MIAFTVALSPELARFVADAVADGTWRTADEFFAYAVGLARTATVLGKPSALPTPAVVPSLPAPVDLKKTPSGGIPVVDLTRQAFDSPAFMSELTKKLHAEKK